MVKTFCIIIMEHCFAIMLKNFIYASTIEAATLRFDRVKRSHDRNWYSYVPFSHLLHFFSLCLYMYLLNWQQPERLWRTASVSSAGDPSGRCPLLRQRYMGMSFRYSYFYTHIIPLFYCCRQDSMDVLSSIKKSH